MEESDGQPDSKVPRLSVGISISECVCIELCAGSAGFSQALKNLGFAVIPIDWTRNRQRPLVRCLQLDLTATMARKIFLDILDSNRVVFVHAAPPCGTGSRARERPISHELKLLGAPEPKPLRSNEFPSGLPNLSGTDLERVSSANRIYAFCAFAAYECLKREILLSDENPTNAYLWLIPPWPDLLVDPRIEANDHQVCMLGGRRAKWSRWMATKGLFTTMRPICDNSHELPHLPWGFVDDALKPGWNFASADEAAYPKELCCRAAQLVHSKCVDAGFVPVPLTLDDPGLTNRQSKLLNRSATGKLPRGRTLPQLVAEFEEVFETVTFAPSKNLKLLRQFSRKGTDGPQELVFVVGRYHEPAEYLRKSLECNHPIDMLKSVDDVTKQALFNILSAGPAATVSKRASALKRWMARRMELQKEEDALHLNMAPHVARILKGKNLLLLGEMLKECGCKDVNLVSDISTGFNLVGSTPLSHELPRRLRPATSTEDELRRNSELHRKARPFNPYAAKDDTTEEVRRLTILETEAGWLGQPISEESLNEMFGTWVSHRRFGLNQEGKCRPIDDCRESGLNHCLTTLEKLDLHDVDSLAEVIKFILLSVNSNKLVRIVLSTGTVLEARLHKGWELSPGGGMSWLGRALDLKAAYK